MFSRAVRAVFMLVLAMAPGALAEQEKIGLVLAGGGARGIAHAGVIRALEEMRVPIHAVAGTSMGALVGGLYAAGMNADDLEVVITEMDWEAAFQDRVERGELPPRRKSDDYDYPSQFKLAFKDGTVSIPLGIVQGQQVQQIIKGLMEDVLQIRDFDQLPIPYRAVATDIETGAAYVFGAGDVVTAMRSSMSLPGLLDPVEHDGRLLVDGGMAMNIPVEVAQQMGVDRLIVVDIGTPLKSRDEITSVVGVADQVLGFLTRKNSEESLRAMAPSDLLIHPELHGLGMLDFDQGAAIYQAGYAAAQGLREPLAALALTPEQWAAYQHSKQLPASDEPAIEFIAVDNNAPISDEIIRVRLRQPLGEPLDREQLLADMAEIYALDYWEIIDYRVIERDGQTGLLLKADGKSWGPDKLKFGLSMVTDLDGTSEFNLGSSYLFKGVNELGGELYGRAQFGDTLLLSGEFYQPLDVHSRFFIVPYIGLEDKEVLTLGPEYSVDETLGSWRVRELRGEFTAGAHIFTGSQLRLGLFRTTGEYRVDLSTQDLIEDDFEEGGVLASYRYDNLDSAFFPTRGAFLYAEYEAVREAFGADTDFERWQAVGQAAFSFGEQQRNTLIFTARTGQTIGATNEPQNYYQLGGLFNLSGFSQNFFSGRQMLFAMAQYQRKLSENTVIPVDMPVYVGASLEGGQLWSDRSDVDTSDLIAGGSIYLGVDSPIGPLYLAYGRSEDNYDAIYLALGWPFLGNQARFGR